MAFRKRCLYASLRRKSIVLPKYVRRFEGGMRKEKGEDRKSTRTTRSHTGLGAGREWEAGWGQGASMAV